MGRPSKLSDAKWEELKARLAKGEKATDLAREYGVSKAAISNRVSKRVETVKAVANQLVSAEDALRSLPVPEQMLALNLAEELRSISMHAASAAKYGMATAHRLAGIAHGMVARIDDAEPMSSVHELKTIAGLTEVSNKAATIGLNLLAANKDMLVAGSQPDVPSGLDHFYGGGS